MIHTLNKTQRRWLALAILLLFLGGILSVTALPVWLASRSNQNIIADMENRLDHMRRAATISTSLRPQYEQLSRWHGSNTQYLKSNSIELAAAELQRLVKRIAVANNTKILSTQILATGRNEENTRVVLKVRMNGELESIVRLFHALETGEPYLFLDNVTIKASGGRRSQRKVSTRRNLDVDLELAGYLQSSL